MLSFLTMLAVETLLFIFCITLLVALHIIIIIKY